MSFEDVDTALKADIKSRRGVKVATMKLVLIAIAQHTSAKRGDHESYPAFKRLAKMTGLSQGAVSQAVDALEEFGAFKEYSRGGGRKRSHYKLNIAKLSSIGIDWLKEQGSPSEPSVHRANPAFTGQTQRSSGEGQGSAGEPNKGVNKVLNQVSYQGCITPTSSLRDSVPPSAVSSHPEEKQNQKPNPKTSGALGVQAKTTPTPKPNPGQRLAQPYRREPEFTEPYRTCKNCGDTLKRDVNHVCKGAAAPLNLGTVDDLTGTGGGFAPGEWITTKDGYKVQGL